jgi:hypothetical protein
MNTVPIPMFLVVIWAVAGVVTVLAFILDAYLWVLKRKADRLDLDRLAYRAAMQCRVHDLSVESDYLRTRRSARSGWWPEVDRRG